MAKAQCEERQRVLDEMSRELQESSLKQIVPKKGRRDFLGLLFEVLFFFFPDFFFGNASFRHSCVGANVLQSGLFTAVLEKVPLWTFFLSGWRRSETTT